MDWCRVPALYLYLRTLRAKYPQGQKLDQSARNEKRKQNRTEQKSNRQPLFPNAGVEKGRYLTYLTHASRPTQQNPKPSDGKFSLPFPSQQRTRRISLNLEPAKRIFLFLEPKVKIKMNFGS